MSISCTIRLLLRVSLALLATSLLALEAGAQISLTTAADLALRNSPRVLMAEAEVDRARAALSEARDIYIPSISVGGSGYGKSYGFPLGQPTIVNVQAQSLVFSYSQRDYVRSSHAGFAAANLALSEAREAALEDTVLTYVALDHDASRENALKQQLSFASRLITIVQDRLSAGQDTQIDLTISRLTGAQIRLRLLQAEDETAIDRTHLAHLIGLPSAGLGTVGNSVPPIPTLSSVSAVDAPVSPGVDSAFSSAHARREQAFGDARYLFRPQVSFAAQYSRLSTYENSDYLEYFGRRDATGRLLPFPSNAVGVGIQVSIPLLDYAHLARARQSAAEATRAERDAELQRDLFTEGRVRMQRSAVELGARAEIAELDQQLAEQQLNVLAVQLNSVSTGAAPTTPKDEQNSRITEREKYLALLDVRFQLQQAQVMLLRQTGGLESWLKAVAQKDSSVTLHPASP